MVNGPKSSQNWVQESNDRRAAGTRLIYGATATLAPFSSSSSSLYGCKRSSHCVRTSHHRPGREPSSPLTAIEILMVRPRNIRFTWALTYPFFSQHLTSLSTLWNVPLPIFNLFISFFFALYYTNSSGTGTSSASIMPPTVFTSSADEAVFR